MYCARLNQVTLDCITQKYSEENTNHLWITVIEAWRDCETAAPLNALLVRFGVLFRARWEALLAAESRFPLKLTPAASPCLPRATTQIAELAPDGTMLSAARSSAGHGWDGRQMRKPRYRHSMDNKAGIARVCSPSALCCRIACGRGWGRAVGQLCPLIPLQGVALWAANEISVNESTKLYNIHMPFTQWRTPSATVYFSSNHQLH